MSSYLWKFYLEDDVKVFQRLLAEATYLVGPHASKGSYGSSSNTPGLASSLGDRATFSTSKPRKTSGTISGKIKSAGAKAGAWTGLTLTRADVNLRDRTGLTILHYAASSSAPNAIGFATALIDHPLCDLYVQDEENGWTALHRALYFGNITVARAIMDRDMRDARGYQHVGPALHGGGIIRVKDREGNSPFDLFNTTIGPRTLDHQSRRRANSGENSMEDDKSSHAEDSDERKSAEEDVWWSQDVEGDEVFTFGSNKNFNLGFGDEDDRQYPERVTLKRPDHLYHRFFHEQKRWSRHARNISSDDEEQSTTTLFPNRIASLPTLIRCKPLFIREVVISKYHTAVVTADPEANLYTCGYGPGGRLGTGDETTRFTLGCVEGGGLAGKRVVRVALGHNHTLAITSDGELFSWGTNTFGQLGYTLPKQNMGDEELVQSSPRQLFGPMKREVVVGIAASRIHSVVHTATALFTFGKNEGQLGLVDADARSLDIQTTPRRVGVSLFAAPIQQVSAIDHATICLLSSNEVWVFANFGYARLSFPWVGSPNFHLRHASPLPKYGDSSVSISKISAGGDTICALSHLGDVFAVRVNQKLEPGPVDASTTNPTKIRNALTTPQRIWSFQKGHMAGRDIGVGQDGSIIICTKSGSVWRRVRRVTIEDAKGVGTKGPKSKDYKFSRVPGLTRVTAVRSNESGVYAAVRKDHDVMKTQMTIDEGTLHEDVGGLLSLRGLYAHESVDTEDDETPRFWQPALPKALLDPVAVAALTSADLEGDVVAAVARTMSQTDLSFDVDLRSTTTVVSIPVHRFMLRARSPILRTALIDGNEDVNASLSDVLTVTWLSSTKMEVAFPGADLLTLVNLVMYLYTDRLVEVWHYARHLPKQAARFRQVRVELIRIASRLEMPELEQALKAMRTPSITLHRDLARSIAHDLFFDDADIVVQLDGGEMKLHSALVCQRCPFFKGLFRGRAGGRWLSGRQNEDGNGVEPIPIDLSHIDADIFPFVLRYLYTDCGEELFDAVVTSDLDEFLDLVIEVMSVANELMLDRLCQICQRVLGRFVTTRNVCHLLNAVAPCSVTDFKDACLEYLCLGLEGMLENHLLDELDDDLMLDLDEAVRTNQQHCLPISRSGQSETQLEAKFPQLVEARHRERKARLDFIESSMRRSEVASGTTSGRVVDADVLSTSPTLSKGRRKASGGRRSSNISPILRPKTSNAELMFEMDEDQEGVRLPGSAKAVRGDDLDLDHASEEPVTYEDGTSSQREQASIEGSNVHHGVRDHRSPIAESSERPGRVWEATTLSTEKLDLREIMAQTPSKQMSNLSIGLSTSVGTAGRRGGSFAGKPSQKERKKQQQQQQILQKKDEKGASTVAVSAAPSPGSREGSASPWQTPVVGPRVSLREVLGAERDTPEQPNITSSPVAAQGRSPMASPTPRQASWTGSPELPKGSFSKLASQAKDVPPAQAVQRTIPLAEPFLQLSMADIISQQQAEQEVIKQAVAKRPLAEIQQEQEFMEWWDAESKKVQGVDQHPEHADDPEDVKGSSGSRGSQGRGRGRTRGRGKGKRGSRGGGDDVGSSAAAGDRVSGPSSAANMHGDARGRGGGRGRPSGPLPRGNTSGDQARGRL
ncbi:MAG: hypothetical protein M1823_004333 [Watsoniomyces obsoletus]|nr:MAG: hypothetical protein M1823_004333 [Watsoniomyces obsoletus]